MNWRDAYMLAALPLLVGLSGCENLFSDIDRVGYVCKEASNCTAGFVPELDDGACFCAPVQNDGACNEFQCLHTHDLPHRCQAPNDDTPASCELPDASHCGSVQLGHFEETADEGGPALYEVNITQRPGGGTCPEGTQELTVAVDVVFRDPQHAASAVVLTTGRTATVEMVLEQVDGTGWDDAGDGYFEADVVYCTDDDFDAFAVFVAADEANSNAMCAAGPEADGP